MTRSLSSLVGRCRFGRLSCSKRAVCGTAMVLVVALAAVSSVSAQQPPKFTAKDLIGDAVTEVGPKHAQVDDAITKFQLGDANGALQHLKNAKVQAKELPPPELLLAKLFLIGRNAAGGRAWIEKAVAADPNDPECYAILGDIALAEGRTTDADLLYGQALALADKFADNPKRKQAQQRKALQGLTAVATRREKWDRAKTTIDQWIKLEPESALAQSALAQVLFYLNKPADAYKTFQEADRLQKLTADRENPPSPMAELNMAQLYQRRDKDDKRTTDLINLAAKNHPKDFGVRLKATQIAMTANLLDVALAQSEEAVKLNEKDLNAKILRGYVARLRGDSVAAERFFELAHLQSPGNFDASNNLALVLAESADKAKLDRATEFAVMNIQRFPINGQSPARFDALSTFGWIQFKRDAILEARQTLAQLTTATAQLAPDSQYYIGQVFIDDPNPKNSAAAIALLTAAVASDQPFVNRKAATELLAKYGGGRK